MSENKLQSKSRFVYSDFDSHPEKSMLEDAILDMNLAIYPMNYENLTSNDFLRLYLFVAESQDKDDQVLGSVQ